MTIITLSGLIRAPLDGVRIVKYLIHSQPVHLERESTIDIKPKNCSSEAPLTYSGPYESKTFNHPRNNVFLPIFSLNTTALVT
ncbi:hypothetical protein VTN49DRAFT_5238 [Thermomyces lanuginosus]|uniref:uncharacterized protein n=1 Tax=Thermomyces lanuginosus TaxID=5541 RepID=UPI0037439D67